jgi:hypothetical protein
MKFPAAGCGEYHSFYRSKLLGVLLLRALVIFSDYSRHIPEKNV